MKPGAASPWPKGRVAVLGLITITVYGSWFYSFGVLLDPIILDTGWGEAILTTGFAASSMAAGIGSIGGGWLLDRHGSRLVFLLASAVGAGSFWLASIATSAGSFAFWGAVGGGTFGALAFYHVTQTAAVRISPRGSTKAIAVLTIWGAFASAIFLPISAWLVDLVGWRQTLRWITASAVVALVVGAITVHTGRGESPGRRHWAELREALRSSEAVRYVASQGLVGICVAVVLVYQVPAMTAAGMTLTAASFWAGVRGFSQLAGRLPLMPIVARLGTVGSLRLAYLCIAAGSLVLTIAGTPWLAAIFALLAGFGIGATSPLNGMYASELFSKATLGTAMGLLSFVFLVVGAVGPVVAGVISASTGSRALPVAIAAILAGLAALVVGGAKPVSDQYQV